MKFKKLFEPGNIGKMEIKNRIVFPPMVTNLAGQFGEVTDHHIEYYKKVAEGGVGLVIIEAAYPLPDYSDQESSGKGAMAMLGIYKSSLIPGLNRLAQTIKDYDARVVIQIAHGGRQTPYVKYPVAASSVFEESIEKTPRALTIDEIEEIEEALAEAALRARTAGFDGVEIHGAHGYLIAGFLSPATNKRTDKYGGSLKNRMRFGLNIVARVREKVGRDYPIIWRNSAKEALPDGLTFDEVKIFAKELEKAGVDAIHLSGGGYGMENVLYQIQPNSFPPGVLVPYAEEMKREKTVDIPIITVGKINNPYLAEEILEKGKADFVSIGRGLIADPDFPKKVAEGRPEDIRKCICCTLCINETINDHSIRCTVNPLVGREGLHLEETAKAARSKKVMVIGGGPAGMEAARVCALRGHEVELYEKTKELGGQQLKLATAAPYKDDLKGIHNYYSVQLGKLDVKIELGVEITASLVKGSKPDVVIIATGAEPVIPDIPGVKRKSVFTPWDVLGKKDLEIGKRVIVVGGGLIGCDTAEFLVEQGKEVTITTRQKEIAYNMEFINKNALLLRFAEKNVRIETEITCKEVTDDGITVADKWGREKKIKADNVILAAGTKLVNSLEKELTNIVPEVYVIGDAKEPRKIWHAISEGFLLGRRI